MRLEQFLYLQEIHRTHSINLAAKKLHVSQQNISQSIKNFESELDLILLERSTAGTNLSPSGLIVLKHAQRIMHELNSLENDVATLHAQNSQLSGRLCIEYVLGFNGDTIYNSLERFCIKYPKIKVSVRQETIANVLHSVHDSTADIALLASGDDFHFNNVLESSKLKDLSIHFLKETPLYAAVSHLSPFAAQKSISLNKLIKYPLVFFYQDKEAPDDGNYLFHSLSKYGKPNIQLITNAFELYVKAIANNQGIGFVTQTTRNILTDYFNEEIVLLSIHPTFSLLQGYAIKQDHAIPEALSAYLPYLIEEL